METCYTVHDDVLKKIIVKLSLPSKCFCFTNDMLIIQHHLHVSHIHFMNLIIDSFLNISKGQINCFPSVFSCRDKRKGT